MGRNTKEIAAKRFDELAQVLAGVGPVRLRQALTKSETVTIRITMADKLSMQRTASRCGLSVTEYLTRLHWLASEKVE